jgi:hypothetical protein
MINERQVVYIGYNISKTGVMAQIILGFFQLSPGVIVQKNLLVPLIQISQPAETGADFNKPLPLGWEKLLHSNTLNRIFIGSVPIFPEIGPVVTPFIITNTWQSSTPQHHHQIVSRETLTTGWAVIGA